MPTHFCYDLHSPECSKVLSVTFKFPSSLSLLLSFSFCAPFHQLFFSKPSLGLPSSSSSVLYSSLFYVSFCSLLYLWMALFLSFFIVITSFIYFPSLYTRTFTSRSPSFRHFPFSSISPSVPAHSLYISFVYTEALRHCLNLLERSDVNLIRWCKTIRTKFPLAVFVRISLPLRITAGNNLQTRYNYSTSKRQNVPCSMKILINLIYC